MLLVLNTIGALISTLSGEVGEGVDNLLLESGDHFTLEDGLSALILG